MNAYVSISKGQWSVSISGSPDVTFSISGKGMNDFFKSNRINEVLCSSSVDFPRDDGAKISGNKARMILAKALTW